MSGPVPVVVRAPGQLPLIAGAVAANGIAVTSGVVDPAAMEGPVPFPAQARAALRALLDALAAVGAGPAQVMKVEAFLADAADFPEWNRAYAEVWPEPGPARTTLVVGFAAPNVRVELQAIAAVA